ncbi:DUF2199 domain-containing protein [Alienimonas chondri]|uniref:DUF2199 domain-containing protein n=1 Tax=Alienimonas chondri TaxID=2681879 RepID=A0ABX1VNQ8_9PLAN|nr:DUF2199 domain-containing protein [Alienimonas chondri]NNJ28006.1 hypothetical protein [Alienimonas chondri]
MTWRCRTCGVEHDELPLCYGAEAPWRALVPEEEFDRRVELNADQCVVDGKVFFLRGHVELPIIGRAETFAWSVWCSLSEDSFVHVCDRWETPDRDGDSYFGWLCTSLPIYPETAHLKTNVRSRPPGETPLVEIQECDHPLFIEQRDGITLEQVEAIAHQLLHDPTA